MRWLFILAFLCLSTCTQAVPADEDITLEAPSGRHLTKVELALWNSPDFRRRFTESYLAETEIEPRVTEDERGKMLKILELISADKMDEAARSLQKQINDASSAVFDFTLANIWFQQDKLEPAALAYEQAVKKYPKFRRAWKNLGVIYVRNNDFAKAIPALTRVIELGGQDNYTFGMLGMAYLSQEDYLAAESAFRMAILLDPRTRNWKMGLADSLYRQERYAEVVILCDRLIKDDPDNAKLWLWQANAYIGMNQADKAAVNYELVDRLGAATVDSLMMLADIYVNQALYTPAVETYVRALEKDPQRSLERAIRAAKVLTSRGALTDTRQLIERIEALQGTDITPDDQKDLLKLRRRIAAAQGSGEEEMKILEEIVSLDPLDGEALILLGQHSDQAGDYEKAVFYFERAENLDKFEANAKVRHAQLLVKQGKYADALPLLRRAQDIKPREEVQKYLEQVERAAKSR